MKSRRQIQVADEIREIFAVLLQRELKDPRIGFVTVTGAEVSSDLKYAKIHVSVLGSPEEKRDTMAALTSSRGFVRREIASRMSIRFTPEITFKLDQSLEYSDNINRLLNELKQADEERAGEGTGGEPEATGLTEGAAETAGEERS